MQIIKFQSGGFVIHKITCGYGKISAWFDNNAQLLDIEKFDRNGRKTGSGLPLAVERARLIGRIHNPYKS